MWWPLIVFSAVSYYIIFYSLFALISFHLNNHHLYKQKQKSICNIINIVFYVHSRVCCWFLNIAGDLCCSVLLLFSFSLLDPIRRRRRPYHMQPFNQSCTCNLLCRPWQVILASWSCW